MNHSPRATHDIPAKSPDDLFCLCKQISCIPKRTFLKIIYTQWDYFCHKQPFRWTNNICFEILLYLFGAKTIQFFTFHFFYYFETFTLVIKDDFLLPNCFTILKLLYDQRIKDILRVLSLYPRLLKIADISDVLTGNFTNLVNYYSNN